MTVLVFTSNSDTIEDPRTAVIEQTRDRFLPKLSESTQIIRAEYRDRLFCQIMRHLYSFFASKILNREHVHIRFEEDLERDVFCILRKDLVTDIVTDEKFQEFKSNSMINDINDFAIRKYIKTGQSPSSVNEKFFQLKDRDIENLFRYSELFSDDHISLIKQAYQLDTTIHTLNWQTVPKLFVKVSVHIRRGDLKKSWSWRYNETEFFIKTIHLIAEELRVLGRGVYFFIYSDSNIELELGSKLKDLTSKDIRVFFQCEEDIFKTVNDMIASDILIMSFGSAVSHFAGLLNEGIVYYDEKKRLPDCQISCNRFFAENTSWIHDQTRLKETIRTYYK